MVVTIFLFSLLIAQLNQAYQHGFQDMHGYARLRRVWFLAVIHVLAGV